LFGLIFYGEQCLLQMFGVSAAINPLSAGCGVYSDTLKAKPQVVKLKSYKGRRSWHKDTLTLDLAISWVKRAVFTRKGRLLKKKHYYSIH